MTIGQKIRKCRLDRGMTRDDLSVESGLSFSGIKHIENGVCTPTLSSVTALAQALEVSIDYLAGLKKEP